MIVASGFTHLIQALGPAIDHVLAPSALVWMLLGVSIGLFVGLVPGLGGAGGMALLLPFLYGMNPVHGIVLMISAIAVIHTADTFPSVLLGVPGSSGAAADIMDGFPLAQQGKAKMALGAAFSASAIGGVIGASVLLFSIPIATPLILAMGSPQLFALAILGLSLVAILSGSKALHGLVAAALGLLLGCVGGAPTTPIYRYTFGTLYLMGGIPIVILAFGLFAVPEIVGVLGSRKTISEAGRFAGSTLEGLRESLRNWKLIIEHSLVGAFLGVIPGIGGAVIDWINYGLARQTIRNNHFGTGDVRGLIAPESGNHSKEGGALIPALFFGIPGSSTNAMILGGLLLLGIDPGPSMVGRHLDLTLTFVVTLAVANVFGAVAFLTLSTWIAKLTTVRFASVAPFLFMITVFGAFQATKSLGDLVALLVVSVLGWVMRSLEWPRPPVLVGFVLADAVERNLWLSSARYGARWLVEPSVMAILSLALIVAIVGYKWRRAAQSVSVAGPTGSGLRAPNVLRTELGVEVVLLGMFIWASFSAVQFQGYAKLLPMVASFAGVAVLGLHIALSWGKRRLLRGARAVATEALPGKSYVAWFSAYIALVVVLGFVPATLILLVLFLRLEDGATWSRSAVNAGTALVCFAAIAHYVIGLWPSGLLFKGSLG